MPLQVLDSVDVCVCVCARAQVKVAKSEASSFEGIPEA